MSKTRLYIVWTWLDRGKPQYVGWGQHGPPHPAKTLWAQRFIKDSPLTTWLKCFDKEPERIDHCGLVRYHKEEARAVRIALQAKYSAEGHPMWDPRPYGTKEGGGNRRQVMDSDFNVYPSVRSAARALGVNACTITRWCQSHGKGFTFIT